MSTTNVSPNSNLGDLTDLTHLDTRETKLSKSSSNLTMSDPPHPKNWGYLGHRSHSISK